jgi:hypothetical protein
MYMTDVAVPTGTSVVMIGVLEMPAAEGSAQPGGFVVPRFVCQTRFPEVSVALSIPSNEPQ